MKEIKSVLGDTLEDVCRNMMRYVRAYALPSYFKFNGITVESTPGSTVTSLINDYNDKCSQRMKKAMSELYDDPNTLESIDQEVCSVLRTQAERLLMVSPGSWASKPITWVRKEMFEMYEFDARSPHVGVAYQKLTALMWNWMVMSEHSRNHPRCEDPSMFGIEKIVTVDGTTVIVTYCHDHAHYTSTPDTIHYKGKAFAKAGWNSSKNRCFFKRTELITQGIF